MNALKSRTTPDTPGLMPATCSRCAVRNESLCGALTGRELFELNAISIHRSYDARQTVVFEGDAASFATVVSGLMLVKKTLEDGREQIVSILFPSDFIGRAFADAANVTVETATPATLCMFDAAGFGAAVDRHPALERKLLEHTLTELDEARDWMLLLGQKTARERLATFLVRLATRVEPSTCAHQNGDAVSMAKSFDLPLTRSEIAGLLGLTIETVSRKFTELRKTNVLRVENNRHVTILSQERLLATASLPEPL